MKIAILGSRGIPAKYGGFETFAEGLSRGLVKRGFEITVSCEYEPGKSRYDEYHGVKLVYFPLKPPRNYFLRKFYETFYDIHSLIKLSRNYDLIYFLGTEVGIFLFIPHILKRSVKLLVNIDGVMWERTKYNSLEKLYLKISHYFACRFADIIIIDAREMENYIKPAYQDKTEYISYGVNEIPVISWDNRKLKDYKHLNINPGKYWLMVARLEPENNIHLAVDAFMRGSEYPLLIVGDFTSTSYQDRIVKMIDHNPHIILMGSIYNLELLDMLRQNALGYVHGHSVGGTNPSLLEAMIMRNLIIAHDNNFNREVAGGSAIYFKDPPDLSSIIQLVEKNVEKYSKLRTDALNRVKNGYLWDKIINDYCELFHDLLK